MDLTPVTLMPPHRLAPGLARPPARPPERTAAGPGGYWLEWRPAAAMDEAVQHAWRGLMRRALEPNVLAGPDVLLAALRHLPEAREVAFLLAWQEMNGPGPAERALRAVVAVERRRRLGATLGPWTPDCVPAGPPPVDRDGPVRTLEAILPALAREGRGAAATAWPGLAPDGAFAQALRQAAQRGGRGVVVREDPPAPASLPWFPVPPEAEARPDRVLVERRQRALFAHLGAVRVERHREAPAVRDALETFLLLEARRRPHPGARIVLDDQAHTAFLRTATRRLAEQRQCAVDLVRLDGQAVAATLRLGQGRGGWAWSIGVPGTAASGRTRTLVVLPAAGLTARLGASRMAEALRRRVRAAADRAWRGLAWPGTAS